MSGKRSGKVDDVRAVVWSADILEKSEFEVFQMAYQAWFREAADVKRLERIFVDYMFGEVVPFWVRQFTRTTLEAHDEWCRDEEMKLHEYLGVCLGAASTTLLSTTGLAFTLFLPHVILPWTNAGQAAFPA